jgi:hypothetical protein
MTFRKGDPKLPGSGRRRGSPNKRKVLCVAEVLERNCKDPIAEVLMLIPHLEPKDAVKVWLELQQYVESKPKEAYAPDESGEENPGVGMSSEELKKVLS